MNKSIIKYISAISICLIFISGIISVFASPVQAVPSYNIKNDIIVLTLNPGQTTSSKITVTDQSTTDTLDFQVGVAGLGQGKDGSNLAISASADTSPYSARTFCSIDKSAINIGPGESQDINVTISVPSGIQKGEYYAAIYMSGQPSSQDKVGIRMASIVPVILIITGFTPVITGQVTNLSAPQATAGQTIEVDTTLKNTGNCRISAASDTVTLLGPTGNQISQTTIQMTSPSILPTFSRSFIAHFSSLTVGSYSVKSTVIAGDGTQIDTRTISFNVVQPTTTPTSTSTPVPIINSFAPSSGTTGTTIVINGYYLTGATSVGFGGVSAQTYTVNSDNQITAIVGSGASGYVSVTTSAGTATSSGYFNFTTPAPSNSVTPTTTISVGPTATATITSTPTTTVTATPSGSPSPVPTAYILPGMDAKSIAIFKFNNQSKPYADAIAKSDTEVTLTGVNGSGTIIIGKYTLEPASEIAFSAGVIKGGTGKQDIKFVDVKVEGYSQGTARVTIHYSNAEIDGFNPDSLFLAYESGGKWHNCGIIQNSTDKNTISGDIPVSRLTGTVVGLGGDLIKVSNNMQIQGQAGGTSWQTGQSTNRQNGGGGFSWSLAAIIVLPIIVIGLIVVAIVENQRKNQKARLGPTNQLFNRNSPDGN